MTKELNGYMVKFLQEVEKGKENSLWYGGDVAEIKYKDLTFIITANGSVIGRIYENKELITSFKDTRNMATFYHTINKYLKNKVVTDKDLNVVKIISEFNNDTFNEPYGVFVNNDGNLYVADTKNYNGLEKTVDFVITQAMPTLNAPTYDNRSIISNSYI